MKKKWLKKSSAILLSLTMALSLFPGMNRTIPTVQAAENTLPESAYWTKVDGLMRFSLNKASDTEGRIIFGQNGSGKTQQWKIAGTDSGINGDNIILFAASPLESLAFEDDYNTNKTYESNWNCTYPDGTTVSEVFPNHYGASDLRTALNTCMSGNSYFSESEKTKMNKTTIYTDDKKNGTTYSVTDTLYAPYGDWNNNTYVTVGTNTSDSLNGGVKINISKWENDAFWLRSPFYDDRRYALVANPDKFPRYSNVDFNNVLVVPAFDLNLSDVSFASAAEAASSSYTGYKANDTDNTMTENTYTLRYASSENEEAVINPNGTKIKVTNANGKYLMVQNSTGVYVLPIDDNSKTVNAGDIQMGSSATDKLENFNNCKVWLESTDADRITTAKIATQSTVTTINSVAITDITSPVAGSAFDTEAACTTVGVSTTTPTVTWTQGGESVTGNTGYNITYTASVTLTAKDGYEFASNVTATIDGKAASVTKNQDGITVSYSYKTAPKTVFNAYFATVDDLKDCYNINGGTVGKIKFGLNGNDARLWAICGADGTNLALLSTSEFAWAAYGSTSEYSQSDFVTNINTYLDTKYFSTGETGKMAEVTVETNEPDGNGGNSSVEVANKKLYLPNSQDQNSNGQKTIYVGSSNDIAIDVTKLNDVGLGKYYWLRSPDRGSSGFVLVADLGYNVLGNDVNNSVSVVPAFDLKLSDVSFASAAEAASSSYSGFKANSEMTKNTFTLRYPSIGKESAVINPGGTQVNVTDANNKYLMVQNSTGVYALKIDSNNQTINASDIQMGSAESDKLANFNNCKVWLESTDADRITTAKMATQSTVTTIDSVAVTDITSPVAGSAFDTKAACATTGVSTKTPTVTWTQGGESVTGNAGYNTTYTASVTLTAEVGYEFASGVTATVNGQNATGVTKNADGTATVTYTFPATAKAKLTGITAPTGITVANGTDYAAMGLPTNVAIVTEGNTETTAAVTWDTTTPASGSYDPRVLAEQSVTLNGTVTCPSNIDANGVTLTTTITVTISAAGIVGTPTFAPVAGTYTENQTVTLSSSTDGATIYYTTDGTTPTTGSHVYSGAISVTGTAGQSISTTIKAIAVKDGMQTSSVASATYVIEIPALAPGTYAVTVNNGTGDGNYAAGATVTITADAAPNGQEFDKWTVVSGEVALASATSATTTFVMPASAVEVTATYKNKSSEPNPPAPTPAPEPSPEPTPTPAPDPSTYAVTVNNGTGGGSYAAGETVTITADAAPSGQEFDKWTVVSGGVTLASATNATTTFEMPASAVEVTATYKNKASEPNPPAPTPAPEPAPTPTYTITAGAGGTYELSTDGTLTITCDGALDKLTGIYVNDKLVDAANYTLRSGSTILTFKASYLNTLSVGTYKVKFQYSDESAETTFVIKEASVKDTSTQDTTTQDTSTQDTTTQDTTTQNTTAPSKKDDVPKTGDNTPIAWLFMIAVISGAGVCYFGRKKKTVR